MSLNGELSLQQLNLHEPIGNGSTLSNKNMTAGATSPNFTNNARGSAMSRLKLQTA